MDHVIKGESEAKNDSHQEHRMCRICQNDSSGSSGSGPVEQDSKLIAPCLCTGSLQYVHRHCLNRWISMSSIKHCELCLFPFKMKVKILPVKKWQLIHLQSDEKLKIFTLIFYQLFASATTIWAITYLSYRVLEHIYNMQLTWIAWVKCLSILLGLIGIFLFTYIHVMLAHGLYLRWRTMNQCVTIYQPSATEINHFKSKQKRPEQSRPTNLSSVAPQVNGNDAAQNSESHRKREPNEMVIVKSLVDTQNSQFLNQPESLGLYGDYVTRRSVERGRLNRICNENVCIQSSTDAKITNKPMQSTAKVFDGSHKISKTTSNISHNTSRYLDASVTRSGKQNQKKPISKPFADRLSELSCETLSVPHNKLESDVD